MELSNWAPEHSDALREFIAKGLSYAAAANAINSRFNTAYSRNAALGRARRLGLGPDGRQLPSRARDGAAARPNELRALPLPWPVPVLKEPKPVKLRSAEVEPRHLSLVELEREHCRYPYGGDDEGEAITFCGHPRRTGSSYCTPHFHLCWHPIEPSDHAASAASAVGGDCMNAAVTSVADKLKRLPRGHRIAHLRALLELEPAGGGRRDELSRMLRREMSDEPVE
jgi:GcrA cell cycle regulator